MTHWEPAKMKSQLRVTAQRLGQMQDRMDSQAQITRRDIVTLLQQDNVALARAKAQKLMNEDALIDLLQTLEMHVGMIVGHLGELERKDTPSPVMLEAAASIVVAAPQIDSKELRSVRDHLAQRLGPEFMRSVNDYVSTRVRRALSTQPASAVQLDQYLYSIAKSQGVHWNPAPLPQQIVHIISEMLDPSNIPVVDLMRLRILCSQGLPDDPPWLRPKAFVGNTSSRKATWDEASRKSRENYYDLVRRLLEPFSSLPPPGTPLTPLDDSLMNASREFSQIPPQLMLALQEAADDVPLCPLDEAAPDDIKIPCAQNLDERLRMIRELQNSEEADDSTPEIRLDSTPEIRLEDAQSDSSDDEGSYQDVASAPPSPSPSASSVHSSGSMTLLRSRTMGAHPKHASALLRLLYLHSCLNPANQSPHIGSLLVPVYSALVEEMVPEDAAHVEADVFWLFEALVGEFADLDDAEGGRIWTQKLSDRLYSADPELAEDLQLKGLDPALPHYSFRWLIPVLTHTLPLRPLLTVWDAILSRPMRERDTNLKLEFLVDVCTGMLLRTKNVLLRLGRPERKTLGLWSDELAAIPSTPLAARELEDAFAEGMTFLQRYPLESAGGVEALLQCACDLAHQRQMASTSLGARLRDTVWKGFAQTASIAEPSEDHDDNEPETSTNGQSNTLTARLASTVWRGISNESAMEAPPSPTSPASPMPPSPVLPPPPSETSEASNASAGPSKFWGYADRLRESDAAATLAKVSTNWKVKAWTCGANVRMALPPRIYRPLPLLPFHDRPTWTQACLSRSASEKRRGGPPRDSVMFTGRSPLSPSNDDISPASDAGSMSSGGVRASLASFGLQQDQSRAAKKKSGPRPLLLNSTSLMTNRSPATTPLSGSSDKSMDNVRGMRTSPAPRDSTSSYSSFSPVHSRSTTIDSDTGGSRIVPIRSSRSPMARGSRRVTPTSSTTSSPQIVHRRMDTETSTQLGSDDGRSSRGWHHVDVSDSPPAGSSPPPPQTPADATSNLNRGVRVKAPTSRTGSPSIGDASDMSSDMDAQPAKGLYSLPRLSVGDTSDTSATQAPSRSPRSKQKRIPPKLSTTRSRENIVAENGPAAQNTLTTGWSDDDDVDNVTTPRAMSFQADNVVSTTVTPRNIRRVRKTSGDGNGEVRTQKISSDGREVRVRKVSTDGHSPRRRKLSGEGEREGPKHSRESSADEGDDEGYRDLLSAYESED
ncbi:regulator of Vps4 activity in the MVB pathway-domain-containing protein [Fomitopsis serialis]|uniref:regulator of Vps4 activity in the MVB pathway-domain-containing protein n=1 Tax=Fomitopsis serialis TaxID=139415 RepID=UPI002007D4C6|nr:regulator of Vps4 activity in the MVB pathway-domain-containing protein [Neoantrodia serialis]KAH9934663.1 regulator of Vps4 activity in the MVB pathway-domain-containing protein [Neoantrodia serialis]